MKPRPTGAGGGADGQARGGVGVPRGNRGPAGWWPAGKPFLHCSPPQDGYLLPPQGKAGVRGPPVTRAGCSVSGRGGGVAAQLGSVMRSGFRKVLGSQPPVECCPSPGLRSIPRILWWVQGRLDPQPWGGEAGCTRAGLCPMRGQPGVPAEAGVRPLRRRLCLGLWFAGWASGNL